MAIKLNVPLSLSGDRELKGGVVESLITHYYIKAMQPASVHLVRYDSSAGSGSYADLSTEASSIGPPADCPVFGTQATMSAGDEFYVSDTKALKEFWANTITAGVFTATGIEIYDSTNGVTFNRQLTGVVDDSNAFRNAGWKRVSWAQPATPGIALALAATSNDAMLSTARIWYKVKLTGFTAATTAPVLARIVPVFIDSEQKFYSGDAVVHASKTAYAGNPLLGATFFPVVGDQFITTYSNPARGGSVYVFRKTDLPGDVTFTAEYFASDDTWKPLPNYVDAGSHERNGPAVLTEPPTHFDLTFDTPADWVSNTISIPLTDGTTVDAVGYHVRKTTSAVPTPQEIVAPVYTERALQYGSANTAGITLPAMTIARVAVELNGTITGTADAGVFQIVNLATGATSQFAVAGTAVQGDIVNVDIINLTFAAGDNLGLERVSGSRSYSDLNIHLL